LQGFWLFVLGFREFYLTSDMEGRAENGAMDEIATMGLSLYSTSSCNMVDGRNFLHQFDGRNPAPVDIYVYIYTQYLI